MDSFGSVEPKLSGQSTNAVVGEALLWALHLWVGHSVASRRGRGALGTLSLVTQLVIAVEPPIEVVLEDVPQLLQVEHPVDFVIV